MSGTLARRRPTDGMSSPMVPRLGADRSTTPLLRLAHCRAFQAPVATDMQQDQAILAQDPDNGVAPTADTLSTMSSPSPSERWFARVRRWLVRFFRTLAGPSSPSPATGRSAVRLPFGEAVLGFREFTAPTRLPTQVAQRLRVKSAVVSTRIARVRERS